MLGRMVGGTETLGWGRWSAVSGRFKPVALGVLGLMLAIGAYLAAQVVVLDHTSALLLDSSVAQPRSPLRPDTPIRLSLQGAGAELRDAQLYRSEGGQEQSVPIQLVPEDAGAWHIAAPDGGAALTTDGSYRLVVHAIAPRPALPTPRSEPIERQFRFSTVASPRASVPTQVVHARWAAPVAFNWSLPMQSLNASVDPPAPLRAWVDQRDPTRTWVQVGGEDGSGVLEGQVYRVQVANAVSTDGLTLRQPVSFQVAVPSRPHFVEPPTQPVTLHYGESLTLTSTTDLSNPRIDISEDASARATVNGKQIVISIPNYQQGLEFDVTVTSATSPDGAPLEQPLTVHLRTPAALEPPTLAPADGARAVTPLAHPAITFPEPVADQEAATRALSLDPPVPGDWQWVDDTEVHFVPARRLPVLMDFRISVKGGPDGPRTGDGGYLDQDIVATFRTAHDKRIDVSLSQQRLQMIEDGQVLRTIATATGVAAAPTPTGTFFVQYKAPQMRFQGYNPDGSHYDIPDVHWVMPFWGDYTIHGAYWRPRFGVPGSDGCVSMTDADAKLLYDWADVGTPITIHS
jgi:lipoprotein-anchoring transpeptidase ErfK/SrfK